MHAQKAPSTPLVVGLNSIAVGLVFAVVLFPRIPWLGWGIVGVGALTVAVGLYMSTRHARRSEIVQSGPATAARLARLVVLRQLGAVTEAEYVDRKDRLLDG